MRGLLISAVLLLTSLSINAQDKVSSVSVELLGAQNTIGVNYDCRLKGNSGFGYRYQRNSGFMFRVGVSPSFNFGDKYGLKKSAFYPYVGLGWSF